MCLLPPGDHRTPVTTHEPGVLRPGPCCGGCHDWAESITPSPSHQAAALEPGPAQASLPPGLGAHLQPPRCSPPFSSPLPAGSLLPLEVPQGPLCLVLSRAFAAAAASGGRGAAALPMVPSRGGQGCHRQPLAGAPTGRLPPPSAPVRPLFVMAWGSVGSQEWRKGWSGRASLHRRVNRPLNW